MTISTLVQYEILKELDASCKKDSDGYAIYKGKCSDESIAKKYKVNVSSVATYRKKLIGKLRIGSPKGKRGKNIATVVQDLSSQVKNLEEQLQIVLKAIHEQQQSASDIAAKLDKGDSQSQQASDKAVLPRPIIQLP